MHSPAFTLNELFAQMGLDDSDAAVDGFIRTHGPVADSIPLHAAPFWNDSQALFLKEAVEADSDWTEVVDQLDALLRKRPDN